MTQDIYIGAKWGDSKESPGFISGFEPGGTANRADDSLLLPFFLHIYVKKVIFFGSICSIS
jgi:hypothetical protein